MTVIKPKDLLACEQRIAELEGSLREERAKKRSLEPQVKVQCTKCDRLTPAESLTYVTRAVHYRYALMGEQDWFYYPEFCCPYCGGMNDLKDRPEVTALKQAFGKIEECEAR